MVQTGGLRKPWNKHRVNKGKIMHVLKNSNVYKKIIKSWKHKSTSNTKNIETYLNKEYSYIL